MPLPLTADGQLAPIVDKKPTKPKKVKPERQHWSHWRNVPGVITAVVSFGTFMFIMMVARQPFIEATSARWGVGSGTALLVLLSIVAGLLALWLMVLVFKTVHQKHPKKDLTKSATSNPEHPLHDDR